jgi:hypothetical protein
MLVLVCPFSQHLLYKVDVSYIVYNQGVVDSPYCYTALSDLLKGACRTLREVNPKYRDSDGTL